MTAPGESLPCGDQPPKHRLIDRLNLAPKLRERATTKLTKYAGVGPLAA
jgi:hypothetical protein